MLDVIVPQAALKEAARTILTAIDQNDTLLNRVSLEGKDGLLYVRGTNRSVVMEISVASIVNTPGAVVVDAELFRSFVQTSPGDEMHLLETKSALSTKCGGVSGKLPIIDTSNYPILTIPTINGSMIDCNQLLIGITSILPFIGDGLAGVNDVTSVAYLNLDAGFVMATDRLRFARHTVPVAKGVACLPKGVLLALVSVLALHDTAVIELTSTKLIVNAPNFKFSTPTSTIEKWPSDLFNTISTLPNKASVTLNVKEFSTMLTAMTQVYKKAQNAVPHCDMVLDTLAQFAFYSNGGDRIQVIEPETMTGNAELAFDFNMPESLKFMTASITIHVKQNPKNTQPILFEGGNFSMICSTFPVKGRVL